MNSVVIRNCSKPVRKLLIGILGFGMLGAGLIMSVPFVPGPGLPVLILSLAVLAAEFVWARWLLRKAKAHVEVVGNRPGLRNNPAVARLVGFVRKISPRRIVNSILNAGEK